MSPSDAALGGEPADEPSGHQTVNRAFLCRIRAPLAGDAGGVGRVVVTGHRSPHPRARRKDLAAPRLVPCPRRPLPTAYAAAEQVGRRRASSDG
ncbi:hypothetical protein [Streptomyces sp. CA-106131]|uniref:hypothetical protein n=1 Tax=Streptomyces sp. CA-106131 TaxID=3240045 RepID=UPI003D91CCE5